MKGLTCKHLVFLHQSQFEGWDGDPKAIFIFTRRINGRNYKNKSMPVGVVTAFDDRKKGEQWCFRPNDLNLNADTVSIISDFLERMNDGRIKLNEKGELTNE